MFVLVCVPDVCPAQPSRDVAEVREIMVECEWLLIPHAEANRLIHRQAASGMDGDAVRQAALDIIAAGRGRSWHRQAVRCRNGQESTADTTIAQHYPESWAGLQMSKEVIVEGDKVVQGGWVPPRPVEFRERPTGYSFECKAYAGPGGHLLSVAVTTGWKGHVDDHQWGVPPAMVTVPLLYECRSYVSGVVRHGKWNLIGLLTPPGKAPGVLEREPPGDRLMLFIRASAAGQQPAAPAPAEVPDQAQCLVEWIVLPADPAIDLMTRFPGAADAASLRGELQKQLDAGAARLLESGYIISEGIGHKASTKSVYEMLAPDGSWTGDERPGKIIEYPPAPPAEEAGGTPVFWPVSPGPGTMARYEFGLEMDADVSFADYGGSISLSAGASLGRPDGIRLTKDGVGFREDLRAASFQSNVHNVIVRSGQPVLMNFGDAPATPSLEKSETMPLPRAAREKVFVFITVFRKSL